VRLVPALLSFRVMVAVGLATICVLTVSHRFNDPDLWYHLRLGQIVWTTHAIPTTDTLSHTAYGHPWTAHEWLAQLAIYGAYLAGGQTGLMLWLAAGASLIVILIYVLCYLRTRSALVSLLSAVCGWLFTTVGLAVRPQMIGYTFLLVELILLEIARTRRRCLWILPPLFAVWVNCHGSFVFGLAALGIWWIAGFQKQAWGQVAAEAVADQKFRGMIVALSGAALALNPIGVKLLLFPFNVAFQQSVSINNNQEWMSPDLRDGRTLGMIAAMGAILLLPLLRRSELYLRELLLTALAFYMATQSIRMMFVFGIVASPVLARLAAPLLGKDNEREHPLANAVIIAACLFAMVRIFPDARALDEQVRSANPVGAVEYVRRARLSGPMLNEYVFGGYLLWALPEHKVFVDGRGDVFDWTGVLAEYGRWVLREEPANLLFDKYKIRFCILPAKAPHTLEVARLPGWAEVYSDKVAAVLVRR
jgi:hypothetical protein